MIVFFNILRSVGNSDKDAVSELGDQTSDEENCLRDTQAYSKLSDNEEDDRATDDDAIQMDYMLDEDGVITLTEFSSSRETNSKVESKTNKRPQQFNEKADSIIKRIKEEADKEKKKSTNPKENLINLCGKFEQLIELDKKELAKDDDPNLFYLKSLLPSLNHFSKDCNGVRC